MKPVSTQRPPAAGLIRDFASLPDVFRFLEEQETGDYLIVWHTTKSQYEVYPFDQTLSHLRHHHKVFGFFKSRKKA